MSIMWYLTQSNIEEAADLYPYTSMAHALENVK